MAGIPGIPAVVPTLDRLNAAAAAATEATMMQEFDALPQDGKNSVYHHLYIHKRMPIYSADYGQRAFHASGPTAALAQKARAINAVIQDRIQQAVIQEQRQIAAPADRTLSNLTETSRLLRNGAGPAALACFGQIPVGDRNSVYHQLWQVMRPGPAQDNPDYGRNEFHGAVVPLASKAQAVEIVVRNTLRLQSLHLVKEAFQESREQAAFAAFTQVGIPIRHQVFGSLYTILDSPNTPDRQYGEHVFFNLATAYAASLADKQAAIRLAQTELAGVIAAAVPLKGAALAIAFAAPIVPLALPFFAPPAAAAPALPFTAFTNPVESAALVTYVERHRQAAVLAATRASTATGPGYCRLDYPPVPGARQISIYFLETNQVFLVHAASEQGGFKTATPILDYDTWSQRMLLQALPGNTLQREIAVIQSIGQQQGLIHSLWTSPPGDERRRIFIEPRCQLSLQQLFQHRTAVPLPLRARLLIATDVIHGLNYLHNRGLPGVGVLGERGFVHRDIKPGNILLQFNANNEPTARLADLGSCIYLEEKGTAPREGTISFLAPEVVRNMLTLPQDAAIGQGVRADIFSMGIVFHELFQDARPAWCDQIRPLINYWRALPSPSAADVAARDGNIQGIGFPTPADEDTMTPHATIGELIQWMLRNAWASRPSTDDVFRNLRNQPRT